LTPSSLRVFAALHWYNAANDDGLSHSQSLLNLAVAFETLLRLPESSKKDRLVDAISLLLGRTDRLDDWADQFYAARSRVAHEGQVSDHYFYASDTRKQRRDSDVSGSLMLYGRMVFQLCIDTLLVGIDLAERADLQEKFITNRERYQKICQLLAVEGGTPSERLLSIAPTLRALHRYQFVSGVFEAGPAIAAVRAAAAALVSCGQELEQELGEAVVGAASGIRRDVEVQRLESIELLHGVFEKLSLSSLSPEVRILRDLVQLVWMKLFPRYYWLKKREQKRDGEGLEPK